MISIIVPIYNQADKLSRCLDGILEQTYKNFEVIVVNDGSSDKSEKIAENYKRNFDESGINYFVFNKENGGAPSARNFGFYKSKGDYLFFCDSDAVLKPNALENMLEKLNNNLKASYAYPNFLWGRKLFKTGEWSKEKLKTGPFIHTMALIRRESFPMECWDESIKKFQDWDLWLTMLKNNRKGIWIDKVLFKIETGGTMSSWLPSFFYKVFPFLPSVKKYNKAFKIIKEKHKLT